jgi:hypothetical protein
MTNNFEKKIIYKLFFELKENPTIAIGRAVEINSKNSKI